MIAWNSPALDTHLFILLPFPWCVVFLKEHFGHLCKLWSSFSNSVDLISIFGQVDKNFLFTCILIQQGTIKFFWYDSKKVLRSTWRQECSTYLQFFKRTTCNPRKSSNVLHLECCVVLQFFLKLNLKHFTDIFSVVYFFFLLQSDVIFCCIQTHHLYRWGGKCLRIGTQVCM